MDPAPGALAYHRHDPGALNPVPRPRPPRLLTVATRQSQVTHTRLHWQQVRTQLGRELALAQGQPLRDMYELVPKLVPIQARLTLEGKGAARVRVDVMV